MPVPTGSAAAALAAADNAATADSDATTRVILLSVLAIGAGILSGWGAKAALAAVAAVTLATGWVSVRHPPPPAGADLAAHLSWRRRRDAGVVLVRLATAGLANVALVASAQRRPALNWAVSVPGPKTWAAWAAGRHVPHCAFLLAAWGRLGTQTAVSLAVVEAVLLRLHQRGACGAILAHAPAAAPFYEAIAARARGALAWGAAAPPAAATATAVSTLDACVAVQNGLYALALAAGTAVRIRPALERGRPRAGPATAVLLVAAATVVGGLVG